MTQRNALEIIELYLDCFFFRVGFFMVYGLCQAASVWCGGENCENRMRRRNELDEFFFSQRNE